MIVYWSPVLHDERLFLNIKEPEPLVKYLKNNFDYLPDHEKFNRCPSVTNYVKNTFVLKSPINLDFTFNQGRVEIHQYDKIFFDNNIDIRYTDEKNYSLSLNVIKTLFFTEDDDCEMEFLKAYFSENDFNQKTITIPGSLNISKWFRPTDLAFLTNSGVNSIGIREDDHLAYVKFKTSEPVKLKRFYLTKTLWDIFHYAIHQKGFMADRSLNSYLSRAYNYFERSKIKKIILREIKNNLME